MYPKFVIFKLLNVSNKDTVSIRKRLLRSAINKRNKELQRPSKEPSLSVNVLSTQLSTIDFYILTKSITSYNKKSLKKSLYTQQKKLSLLTRIATYLYSQLMKLLLISRNMNNPKKNLIYLKQIYAFQSNQTILNIQNYENAFICNEYFFKKAIVKTVIFFLINL